MPKNSNLLTKKWLFNRLKSYLVNYHDYPSENYVYEYLIALKKGIVQLTEQVIAMGVISFLFLYGINMLVPSLSKIVNLTHPPYVMILFILLLGVISLSIRQIWRGIK